MSIVLDDHAAAWLAQELSVLEDWLAHTESAREELAGFAFQRCPRPARAVEALIADLGDYSIRLRRPDSHSCVPGPHEEVGSDDE